MPWTAEKARNRISEALENAPKISAQSFVREYLPQYELRAKMLKESGQSSPAPLFRLGKDQAVLVDTVQIYINLMNYAEQRLVDGQETEAGHGAALKFLHFYYSACDRVMEYTSAQRVDFHGGRMHAVVINRVTESPDQQLVKDGLEFVREFQIMAEQANRELAAGGFPARFRIGVDVGRCVAINNGTGYEQEPMFLGSAANHAAHLAEGDQPGVYLSNSVRALLSMPQVGILEKSFAAAETEIDGFLEEKPDFRLSEVGGEVFNSRNRQAIDTWRHEIHNREALDPTNPEFVFHRQPLPLSSIDFKDVTPAKSIRMPLMSVMADISGYTAYIDECVREGRVAEAVRALHVIRQEFQSVIQQDFGGRKIRFIGDCIHAVIAQGTSTQTNRPATVDLAAQCAGGLRSSFEICQSLVQGAASLGLSIGMEIGETPITRLGVRGERSVRVASSNATETSEQMQSNATGGETRLGPNAVASMSIGLADQFDNGGVAVDLTYDDVALSLSLGTEEQAQPAVARAHGSSNIGVPRAHSEVK